MYLKGTASGVSMTRAVTRVLSQQQRDLIEFFRVDVAIAVKVEHAERYLKVSPRS